MVSREFADSDSPYAGKYIESYDDDDPCSCGHTLEWHDQGDIETNWKEKCNKDGCSCKNFDFEEYEHEGPDRFEED